MVLFLFTGLALKVYLNERPIRTQGTRLRCCGSFYVFALWIGFGVYALYELLKDYLKPKIALPLVLSVTLLSVPILMASQTGGRPWPQRLNHCCLDGENVSDSCGPDAILFTIGTMTPLLLSGTSKMWSITGRMYGWSIPVCFKPIGTSTIWRKKAFDKRSDSFTTHTRAIPLWGTGCDCFIRKPPRTPWMSTPGWIG